MRFSLDHFEYRCRAGGVVKHIRVNVDAKGFSLGSTPIFFKTVWDLVQAHMERCRVNAAEPVPLVYVCR